MEGDNSPSFLLGDAASGSATRSSIDSTAQIGDASVIDWQEECYQTLKSMKEQYFTALTEFHRRIVRKMQQPALIPPAKQSERHENLKSFRTMLEHMLALLQINKNSIPVGMKEKLPLYEKQILNIVAASKPKSITPEAEGQLLFQRPSVANANPISQQPPPQVSQLQPPHNHAEQLQKINMHGSGTSLHPSGSLGIQTNNPWHPLGIPNQQLVLSPNLRDNTSASVQGSSGMAPASPSISGLSQSNISGVAQASNLQNMSGISQSSRDYSAGQGVQIDIYASAQRQMGGRQQQQQIISQQQKMKQHQQQSENPLTYQHQRQQRMRKQKLQQPLLVQQQQQTLPLVQHQQQQQTYQSNISGVAQALNLQNMSRISQSSRDNSAGLGAEIDFYASAQGQMGGRQQQQQIISQQQQKKQHQQQSENPLAYQHQLQQRNQKLPQPSLVQQQQQTLLLPTWLPSTHPSLMQLESNHQPNRLQSAHSSLMQISSSILPNQSNIEQMQTASTQSAPLPGFQQNRLNQIQLFVRSLIQQNPRSIARQEQAKTLDEQASSLQRQKQQQHSQQSSLTFLQSQGQQSLHRSSMQKLIPHPISTCPIATTIDNATKIKLLATETQQRPEGSDTLLQTQNAMEQKPFIQTQRGLSEVSHGSTASCLNPLDKRLRIPENRSSINCESYSISEHDSNMKRMKLSGPVLEKVVTEKPTSSCHNCMGGTEKPKEPTFRCPICLGTLVSPFSTLCGHLFCEECIKASLKRQKVCPTCRRKLTGRDTIHQVFLPTVD